MVYNPIPAELREQFRELHALGYGRNRLARELGIAPVQVSRGAEAMGLTFDRAKIQAATEARMADIAERRSILAEDLLADAEKLRAQMWQETTVYSFGGKDNTYEDHTFDEAPAAEKRALMSTAGMAIDRSLKLVPPTEQQGPGTDDAKSMLGKLARGIAELVEEPDEVLDEGE